MAPSKVWMFKMTDNLTPEQLEILNFWLIRKPLYEPYGNCGGCLPNGEAIDEEPEIDSDDGSHYEGLCSNCIDTALEIDEKYASKLLGYTPKQGD